MLFAQPDAVLEKRLDNIKACRGAGAKLGAEDYKMLVIGKELSPHTTERMVVRART
jgi:hypothetical protein